MQGAHGVGGGGYNKVYQGGSKQGVEAARFGGKGAVSTVSEAKSLIGTGGVSALGHKDRQVSTKKEMKAVMGSKVFAQYIAKMDALRKKAQSFVMSIRVLMQYQMVLHAKDVQRMFSAWQEQALMLAIAMRLQSQGGGDSASQFEKSLKELQKVYGADLRSLLGKARESSGDDDQDIEAIIECWSKDVANQQGVQPAAGSGAGQEGGEGEITTEAAGDRMSVDASAKDATGRDHAMALSREYLSHESDLDREQLNGFVSRMVREGAGRDSEDYILSARAEFSDPTHQYVALAEVARGMLAGVGAAAGEGVGSLASREVGRALNTLDSDSRLGPRIRAGLASAAPAVDLAKAGIGDTAENRELYRQVLLEFSGIWDTYHAIEKHYGTEHFPKIVAFLVKSIGADLHAARSSIEPERLMQMVNDVYIVEVLGNTYHAIESLLTIGAAASAR